MLNLSIYYFFKIMSLQISEFILEFINPKHGNISFSSNFTTYNSKYRIILKNISQPWFTLLNFYLGEWKGNNGSVELS